MSLEIVYALLGAFFLYTAWSTWRSGQGTAHLLSGGFWLLYGALFLLGDLWSDFTSGILVIILALLASLTGKQPSAPNQGTTPAACPFPAARTHNSLFLPLLCVPIGVVLFSIAGPFIKSGTWHLVDPSHVGQSTYMLATLLGLAVACVLFRPGPSEPLEAGAGILRQIGWAAIVPQMLAALGGVYALAGLNDTISGLLTHAGLGSPLVATLVYTVGMAALTALIGNAFAAFPVMFGACGLPFLIHGLGAPVAPVAAIGMLCGFCGTLLTPMAVNFNIVPVYLLGLTDRNAVIRAQMPTALAVFAGNTLLLYLIIQFGNILP
ncbi:DUF979 family protein [Gluconacetobacter sp. 1c LMG 22058]|uniref:DUF979 family protein n=1 Tax=Gluconacetobacter dulcium TaxID=2729096 RepID=A0A7W4JXQ2_9PROT|nr:DUF979 family protein [Gluconacetobacter dulcium]MBB2196633.1 DUF979 family protein [Gluconacetobacter dulcium]